MIDATHLWVRDLITFALGAAATLVAAAFKAWLDRGTHVSNELFERRLSALNDLWLKVIHVRGIFWQKLALGNHNWRLRHYGEASQALYDFKVEIDKSQVVLDPITIDGFRDIHEFLFSLRDDVSDDALDTFTSDFSGLIAALSAKVNQTMSKRNHKIRLQLKS